jgi:two-component system, OmpR family, response regulator ChvI
VLAGAEVMTKTRVAIVDDDDLFRESLETNLVDAGFDVVTFPEGASALSHFRAGPPLDLVLLDWKMPGLNGIEVLRQLRDDGNNVPVIFLTVLSDQIYEEAALSSGAVDFVEKSRSFSILLRRIELILGGSKGGSRTTAEGAPGSAGDEEPQHLHLGRLELNLKSSRAFWKQTEINLSLTEFRMVHYLATHAGEDVRYRDLYDLVHGEGFIAGYGEDGYRTNVRTFIKRVRKKFRDVDRTFDAIENYPGFGYRWRDDALGDG